MAATPGGLFYVDFTTDEPFFNMLAGFAVEVHKKKQNSSVLEFVKVLLVEEQIVDGTMYYIILEAKDASEEKNAYMAKVCLSIKDSLELVELKKLHIDA